VTAPIAAAPAAAPATTTPTTPVKNGAHTEAGQPPAVDPKVNAKPAETQAEKAWRLKKKIKVGGKEHDVDMGEDDVVREIQKARHYESQREEFNKRQQDFEARQRKLAEEPDEFFRENNIDLESILAERGKRMEEMKALSPEQQRIRTLEEQIQKHAQAEQKRVAAEKQQAEVAEQNQRVSGELKLYGETFKLLGQEVGKPGAASLLRTFAIVREMAEHAGEPAMSPPQLAQAAERFELQQASNVIDRLSSNEAWRGKHGPLLEKMATGALKHLKGEALLTALGPELERAVVAAAWQKTRNSPTPIIQSPPTPDGQPRAPAPNGKATSEWDVMERLGG
jgi:hypothetical protein